MWLCTYYLNINTFKPTYLRIYVPMNLHTYVPTYLSNYVPTYIPTFVPKYLLYVRTAASGLIALRYMSEQMTDRTKWSSKIMAPLHPSTNYLLIYIAIAYACSRPSGPKPEIQHNRRGRGVPTLTWEEVTIREGRRRCCVVPKRKLWAEDSIWKWSLAGKQGTCILHRILHNPIYPSVHSELAHMASSERSHIMY